jgi:hypothetical protein
MRKLTLIATAAMFIGAQAALAAPLPSATGATMKGMDETPIVSVKKKKRSKRSRAGSMESQPGNPNMPAGSPTQGGATQGSGSMGGGGGMGGAPTSGTSR